MRLLLLMFETCQGHRGGARLQHTKQLVALGSFGWAALGGQRQARGTHFGASSGNGGDKEETHQFQVAHGGRCYD